MAPGRAAGQSAFKPHARDPRGPHHGHRSCSHVTVPDLFVYGTLMPHATTAYGRDMRARLGREARLMGAATVCARLYDLGQYPGLVPSTDPSDVVHGVVLRLTDSEASLPWLDAYEGVTVGNREIPCGAAANDEASGDAPYDVEASASAAAAGAAAGVPGAEPAAAGDEYARRLCAVRLAGGSLLSAWVYVCLRPVAPSRLIADGIWTGSARAR